MAEKLIVCSVLDAAGVTPVEGLVQAWGVDSLHRNLRRQRQAMGDRQFLPVTAFVIDPEWFRVYAGLPSLPHSTWLGWLARFRDVPIEPAARPAIFHHYTTLTDNGVRLFDEWAAVAGA